MKADSPCARVAITPRLRGLTYGSEEYRASLREMKPAIDHHLRTTSHCLDDLAQHIDRGRRVIELAA